MKALFSALSVGLALMVMGTSASAVPVRFTFDITVESIGADDLNFFAPAGLTVGSTISGSFEYDDAATNLFEFSSNFDAWTFTSFATEFGGGSPIEIAASSFGPGDDSWELSGVAPVGASTFPLFVRLFVIGDFGFAPIVGDGLGKPVQGPPVLDGLSAFLAYGGPGEPGGSINGTAVFSTVPAAISLPPTLLLLLVGLAGVALLRRGGSGAASKPPFLSTAVPSALVR